MLNPGELKKIAIIALAGAVFFLGCHGKNNTVTEEPTTQSEIENIINQNPSIFSVDQQETSQTDAYAGILATAGNELAPVYYVDASTATLPVAWFRLNNGSPDRTITVSQTGDTAIATISTNWHGKLYIDRTRDGKINPGTKTIEDTGVKKAYFEKVFGIWNLKKLSCVDHNLTDIAKQTVDIMQVEAKTAAKNYTITDPTSLMDIDTEIPVFTPGTQVMVIVTVRNTKQDWDPATYVYLHHGELLMIRDLMYDDGTHGDEIIGDGKYSRSYTVGTSSTVYHHAAVDVLDSGCLQDETLSDYNSTVWRIPYKIQ